MDADILQKKLQMAYHAGYADGLKAFAIWRDGIQWLGDPPKQLSRVLLDIDAQWNYDEEYGEKFSQ